MKKFYLLLTFILAAKLLTAQEAPFITTWEVTANDLEIRIPNSTGDYNYSVDFGDGTIFNNQTSNTNHTYETPGIYTISITGVLPSYKVFFTDKQQIRTVEQWGDLEWEYMDYSFTDCENLIINATDTPNMSQVVTMKEMFKGCLSFNQNINSWDVSNVQDMEGLFDGASSFNQPLNNWNVSNVTNMKNMFNNAQSFNQNLSFWDISNVTNFLSMFRDAISFNQDLSNWQFNTGNLDNFLNNSGINSSNYENLLFHLSVLNIDNGNLGALNLEYCNQQPRDYLLNELNWDIFGDIPSETCNTIISTVSFDQDNNGCDENDIYSDNISLSVSSENYNYITFSSGEQFSLGAIDEFITLSVNNLPPYFDVSPESVEVTFTEPNQQIEQNFCLTANQSVEDLNITLLPINQARPGFEADYQLVIENMGTQILASADISLIFDESAQSFLTATPSEVLSTANELTFEINDLQPLGQQIINFTMLTFQPPTVNGNDILNFTVEVAPNTNDYTPEDNTFNYEQIVVNSYDPNDKQVLQGPQVHIDDSDQYLDYLIRFQNTGTASAVNIRVVDTLHPNLDYSTLKPISASDNYRVKITNDNQVEFIFDDINLPQENLDEEGSNGFIAYKIKAKDNVAIGDLILGNAQIYFDFNSPIITNMVSTEFVDNLGMNNANSEKSQVVIYPNPIKNILNLKPNDGVVLEEISIYDLQGKKLLSFNENLNQLNLENLSSGIYILNIKTDKSFTNKQLIKR
ncbi:MULTISPECIES: BspA family leucine-rich repeat surface protein [Mesonia]|mgnify:CR=1 FL=1|uniref:Uncharacterized protein n=1 Tax=Mesonia oceanica TaxID=2687242 RepID=A0AC61Y979_9FLAO|nr:MULTISPECIES: BspA family leucine-rich repeat surface protein [Mesonia]MAN27794.1 hypothetical protein [Mesonia sp.]MAQ40974.1 hypothetical protein [Mesonia sp.]MBJ96486.1 hypothetical protein [Flavobacteriaceae bacterium]VVV01066.1 hypothetical protein FVB9532_02344 [Mesonia oceanica]|tara:strand:- start:103161 stop:105398 length:2238 start_codon:yes stop_codon:yes gene_type:complete